MSKTLQEHADSFTNDSLEETPHSLKLILNIKMVGNNEAFYFYMFR